MNNEVLILGGDHHNTLGIIESLALEGIQSKVIIFSNSNFSYVLKSRFVKKGWICKNESEVINCMLSDFKDTKCKTVVIAANDDTAHIIDKNATKLRPFFILPISEKQGDLSNLMNKQLMTELAQKVGLNIPKTLVVTDLNRKVDIEYPCITKAISSIAGTKDNIRICYNEQELEDFLKNQEHCSIIQVQKFIDKEYEFQFLGCSLNGGEKIIIPGRTHVDRPNGIDNTFFLKFTKCEESLKETLDGVKRFIKATHYSGLFSVEFLRGKDGINYFTEMNFRNDGNAYCVTDAGVNLPYIWYRSAVNPSTLYSINVEIKRDSYIMPELYYTKRMLAGEVPFSQYYSNFKRTTCFTTYFKQDKKAFFYFLYVSLGHLVDIILKKLKKNKK